LLHQYKNKEKLCFLEIGSYEGRSTLWLLENVLTHPTSTITCVDSFTQSNTYNTFINNTKNYKSKIALHRDYSFNVLIKLNKRSDLFDAVYIDGDHSAKGVLEDAVLSFPLLKKGGLLIFDDYQWAMQLPPQQRPEIAINAFIESYANRVKIVYVGYQVVLQKKG
jgi:predicted O-methyltransferase YrrM